MSGLANPKSVGQFGRLEIQTVLRQNCFFFGKSFLLLRSSTDWTKPKHFIEDNLLLKIKWLHVNYNGKYLHNNT